MMRLALPLLLVLATACAPAPEPEEVTGTWLLQTPSAQEKRRMLVLDESGRLHLLGFADRQGIEWEAEGDRLDLTMLSRSSGMRISESLSYSLVDAHQLHVSGASPLAGTYAREDDATLRLDGELTLPEGHEFPSGSVLALVIEGLDADGEVTDAMDHQLERLPAGARTTRYQIHLDPQALIDATAHQLRAKIIVDGAPTYASHQAKALDATESKQTFDLELKAIGNAAAPAADPGEPEEHSVIRHGHYMYFAGTATFTECNSGRRWSVASGGVAEQLQNTYLDHREERDRPVLLSLRGQIREDRDENDGLVLHAENLQKVLPAGTECVKDSADLENTYWKAERLTGTEIRPDESRQQPHMVLDSDEQRAFGELGCNRFRAGYEASDGVLELSRMSITRRACERGEELESRFSEVLKKTRGYRLDADRLNLLDEEDSVLAELQAVYRLP